MVSRGDETIVLWPHYFDSTLSVKDGRRVPADSAVRRPTFDWLQSAAKKAGLQIVTCEEKAKHPSRPWEASGRILVKKTQPKQSILRLVATQMQAGER